MNVNIALWRARIGSFGAIRSGKTRNIEHEFYPFNFFITFFTLFSTYAELVLNSFSYILILAIFIPFITCGMCCFGLIRIHRTIPLRNHWLKYVIFLTWECLNLVLLLTFVIENLLIRSGIETNPGPPGQTSPSLALLIGM